MSLLLARLLVALVVAGYWGRVLKMARRQRRKQRRSNLLPREPVGLWLRAVWSPVIGLWVVLPFVAALRPKAGLLFSPLWNNSVLAWSGAAMALGALVGTVFCWRAMGRAWRMGIDPDEKTPLISGGPYALARHPIYSLSQLMMTGTILACGSPLLIAAGIVHVLLLQWEARREETHMVQVHGPAYEAYRLRVGAFIPRPRT